MFRFVSLLCVLAPLFSSQGVSAQSWLSPEQRAQPHFLVWVSDRGAETTEERQHRAWHLQASDAPLQVGRTFAFDERGQLLGEQLEFGFNSKETFGR